MKKINILSMGLFLLTLSLISSCSSKKMSVRFTAKPATIYHGDSVKLSWKIRNPKNMESIFLNDSIPLSAIIGDTIIKPDSNIKFKFTVGSKKRKRPLKREKTIKVNYPKIHSFSAYRDRFQPEKIIVDWRVSGVNDVKIESFKSGLANMGRDSLYSKTTQMMTIVASNPFETISQTCYVGSIVNTRPFIQNDTAIEYLPEKHRINLEITETDISNFPNEIKLKAIVYDSLGHFIRNLAPPYASEEIAQKYFRKLTDKAKETSKEITFEVKEVHKDPSQYDIAMVLDYSGSMDGYIVDLEEACKDFIRQKHPDDQYSILKFDNKLLLKAYKEKDTATLLTKGEFNHINPLGGSTAMYAAVNAGLRSLGKTDKKKMVVLFTDGFENASFQYLFQYAATINQLIDTIRKQNAYLSIIGLGRVNELLLRELSLYTNGSFLYIDNPKDIDKAYNDILHQMRTYYEITAKPLEGKEEHILQVEYFNNDEIQTTQRPYYIGSSADFLKYEEDSTAYWFNKELKEQGYKLAAAPQTLVNFQLDEDQIDSTYFPILDNMVKFIRSQKQCKVEIFGHTDSKDDEDYNQDLSNRRAKAVFQYFRKKGIQQEKLTWKGMGEKEPIYQIESSEWMARENRRVVIVLWVSDFQSPLLKSVY